MQNCTPGKFDKTCQWYFFSEVWHFIVFVGTITLFCYVSDQYLQRIWDTSSTESTRLYQRYMDLNTPNPPIINTSSITLSRNIQRWLHCIGNLNINALRMISRNKQQSIANLNHLEHRWLSKTTNHSTKTTRWIHALFTDLSFDEMYKYWERERGPTHYLANVNSNHNNHRIDMYIKFDKLMR